MIDGDECGAVSEMTEWQGKPKYSEETCPSCALSTTDCAHGPGSNTGLRGANPQTFILTPIITVYSLT
jgi:hypothetical protein